MCRGCHRDANDWMPCGFQCSKSSFTRAVAIVFQTQIDKDAIIAIDLRLPERLAFQRDQRLAVLAGGFGDQLFSPCTEACDTRRAGQGQLVAAMLGRSGECKAELNTGIFRRRRIRTTGADHRSRKIEKRCDIDSGRCCRHETERREDRVAAADGRLAMEDLREAARGCRLLER